MYEKLKILVITGSSWDEQNCDGNTLSNIFSGINAEFAHITGREDMPNNFLCKRYFMTSDRQALQSILGKGINGYKKVYEQFPGDIKRESIEVPQNKKNRISNFIKNTHSEILFLMRDICWLLSKWKTKALDEFVLEFNPDVIFAPCYGTHYSMRLTRYINKICDAPIVSFVADDGYSLKQIRFSPVFWFNRFWLRKDTRETVKCYDFLYFITEEQREEWGKFYVGDSGILQKKGVFSEESVRDSIENPVRFIYAGGLYCKRWKTLLKLSNIIDKINADGEKKAELNIYTDVGNIPRKVAQKFRNYNGTYLHGLISAEQLKREYQHSDVALHVESFSLKYKYQTRLSFSTKIIDCMESGCAILAICWKEHAGLRYLRRENAAICVDDLDNLEKTVYSIISDRDMIPRYSRLAFECGKRNHDKNIVQKLLVEKFLQLKEGYNIGGEES